MDKINIYKDIAEMIKGHEKFVIFLPKLVSGDDIASSLAMLLVLERLKKKAHIVCDDFTLAEKYAFLPKNDSIFQILNDPKKFVIEVDTSHHSIESLSYETKGHLLKIFITPKNEFLSENNISLHAKEFQYDLIFTIGAEGLESLGSVYVANNEFFSSVPIINIDYHAWNDRFGQVNLIDDGGGALAEMFFQLFEHLNEKLIDSEVATCLFTGIVSATQSFRSQRTTEKSFDIANCLIETHEARREEVLRNLYGSKEGLPWNWLSKIISQGKRDENLDIFWITLQSADREGTQATPELIFQEIEDNLPTMSETKYFIIFYEKPGEKTIGILCKTYDTLNLRELFQAYHPIGSRDFIHFQIENRLLAEVEKKTIEFLKAQIKKTPGLSPLAEGEGALAEGKESINRPTETETGEEAPDVT